MAKKIKCVITNIDWDTDGVIAHCSPGNGACGDNDDAHRGV